MKKFIIFKFFCLILTKSYLYGDKIILPKLAPSPKIDGVIDKKEWKDAFEINDFHFYFPPKKIKPACSTLVYIGYDESNLYIGVYNFENNLPSIRKNLSQRDQLSENDGIFIYRQL